MCKSSTEYTELFGLRYYQGFLNCHTPDQRCEDWVVVYEWITNRIRELEVK